MTATTKIWITDKTGKKFWNTSCSTEYMASEYRNMRARLKNAYDCPAEYKFLDVETAEIKMVHGEIVNGEFVADFSDGGMSGVVGAV